MSEFNLKDSAIKLFGRTIPLPLNQEVSFNAEFDDDADANIEDSSDHNIGSGLTSLHEAKVTDSQQWQEGNKTSSENKFMEEDKQEDGASHRITEDLNDPTTGSGNSKNPKMISVDTASSLLKPSKGGEQSDAITEEKTLKKPDKIVPCPRCNSMDTKFCYYNNYNLSQPRHFCKNCQRYWTAGGTMRNMPVGAGRRKNKNYSSASHYRQIMVLEALPTAQPNSCLGNNGTVLTFGSDSHLTESMPPVSKQAEKSQKCVQNGFHRPEQNKIVACRGGDNGDDGSSGSSSVTAPNSSEKNYKAGLQEPAIRNHQVFPSQVPSFPGPPWPYLWNPVQWNAAMHQPAFYPSGIPIPFYPPPAYWGCTVPSAWNIPCLAPSAPSSNPNSSLGKHSRAGNILTPVTAEENSNSESCVWTPKTLRIDDPTEAAKSSIWTTLGIQSEKNTNSAHGSDLFKAFQSTTDDKTHSLERSPLLQANPAAFSRSLNFQETT